MCFSYLISCTEIWCVISLLDSNVFTMLFFLQPLFGGCLYLVGVCVGLNPLSIYFVSMFKLFCVTFIKRIKSFYDSFLTVSLYCLLHCIFHFRSNVGEPPPFFRCFNYIILFLFALKKKLKKKKKSPAYQNPTQNPKPQTLGWTPEPWRPLRPRLNG